MYEPEFMETVSRAGADWSVLTDVLLPIVIGLIIACLSWLFGWTGRERKQERENFEIRDGIHIYILHFSKAARAAFPDATPHARRLVDAIDSQLGPLLAVCAGVSSRAKTIKDVLDLSKPLSTGKPASKQAAPPTVCLEEAHVLVPGDVCRPAEVREGFLVKSDGCSPPPKESDLARDRRAHLLEALEDFHHYWSDRPSRLAELAGVQHKLTEVRPPQIPTDHTKSVWKAPNSAH